MKNAVAVSSCKISFCSQLAQSRDKLLGLRPWNLAEFPIPSLLADIGSFLTFLIKANKDLPLIKAGGLVLEFYCMCALVVTA